MTDHVSIIAPPLALADPAATPSNIIAADGWFPPVNLETLRREAKIDATVTLDRLRAAVHAAMETALIDLDSWRAAREGEGHTSLTMVPARTIDGTSRLVRAWHHAIRSLTKCELTETSRDYDATGQGERSLGALEEAIIELRRDAAHAIRDLKQVGRTNVELL